MSDNLLKIHNPSYLIDGQDLCTEFGEKFSSILENEPDYLLIRASEIKYFTVGKLEQANPDAYVPISFYDANKELILTTYLADVDDVAAYPHGDNETLRYIDEEGLENSGEFIRLQRFVSNKFSMNAYIVAGDGIEFEYRIEEYF